MKQVLLAIRNRRNQALPPVTMWMGDDAKIGDTMIWRGRICTVDQVYGTTLSCGKVSDLCRPGPASDGEDN